MVAVAKQRVEKESDEISAGQAALRYEVMLGTQITASFVSLSESFMSISAHATLPVAERGDMTYDT